MLTIAGGIILAVLALTNWPIVVALGLSLGAGFVAFWLAYAASASFFAGASWWPLVVGGLGAVAAFLAVLNRLAFWLEEAGM